jgi:hypothetical protein
MEVPSLSLSLSARVRSRCGDKNKDDDEDDDDEDEDEDGHRGERRVLFRLLQKKKKKYSRAKNQKKIYGRRCIRSARIEDSGEKGTRETSAREEDCGFVQEIYFFARRARGRGK